MTTLVSLEGRALDVVGIVGSRGPDPERGRPVGWDNYDLILRLVARIQKVRRERGMTATIISGGAPSGVDFQVRLACRSLGICFGEHLSADPTSVDCPNDHFFEMPAEWRGPDGKGPFDARAGFTRNDKLVRHCTLVIALFAPGRKTPGTSDVLKRCAQHKVPVITYHEGVWT